MLAAGFVLGAPLAQAQNATWNGATVDWNDPTNWTPNAPPSGPTGTATFGPAGSPTVFFNDAVTTVGTILFTTNAQLYTFNVCFCQELQLNGAGIVNNSAFAQQFANEGALTFLNASSAGNAAIANVFGGTIDFRNTSSAGQATIDNVDNSVVNFRNNSTAGAATINNTDGAEVTFFNFSTGGTATINNSSSGLVIFTDRSSAAGATITNNDGAATIFDSQATAANATIKNFGFGSVQFYDRSTAGSAIIENNEFGTVSFSNRSTAGSATITNNSVLGMAFLDQSTAGDATIITKSGAQTLFFDRGTGGNAQFITEAGGIVDFSGTDGANNDGQVTAGSIAGAGDYFIGANNTLTVGSNNLSTEVSGIIADVCGCAPGPGSLVKVGTGTLTLSGINTYTGTTTVNAGTLIVNGSIATSSLLTVNAGGTVGGTGFLPSTVIDGGTLSPGNSIGTINVTGALQFSSAGVYKVELLGAAADKTNVTGAATLAGTVQVVPLSTTLQFGTPYTILTAAGGTIGQFGGATSSAPLTLTLAYVGNDVLLSLAPNLGGVNGLNTNQRAVGRGLDQGMIQAGGTAGYDVLFQLPASQIPNALTQLSGELGTGAAPAGLLSMNEFLKLMIDPFAGSRGEDGATGPALGFAADHRAPVQAMDAYAAFRPFNKAPVAPPIADLDRWTAWGAAYGSYSRADGDGVVGSQDRTVRTGHVAGGFERRLSPNAVIGFALSGGSARFNLSNGLGSGRGEILQGGFYGAWRFDSYYLSASLAASYYDVSSDRVRVAAGRQPARRLLRRHRLRRPHRRRSPLRPGGLRHHPVRGDAGEHGAHRRLQRAPRQRIAARRARLQRRNDVTAAHRSRRDLRPPFRRDVGRHALLVHARRLGARILAREFGGRGVSVAAGLDLLGAGRGAVHQRGAAGGRRALEFRQRADLARQDRGRILRPRHHLQRQRGVAESLVVSGSRRKIRPPSRWRPYPFPDRDD